MKNNTQDEIDILKKEFNLETQSETVEKYALWKEIFIKYNSHTNLMSKNDVNLLFEKHVFDSLSILKWDKFLSFKKILDVGTGGGFPSVILAIFFPSIKIYANDSRIKKINFIKEIKEKLNLDNLEIIYSRIEEYDKIGVDLIVSRAVGGALDVFELSKKHYNKDKNCAFLIYKAKLINEEKDEFIKKYKKASFNIIPYKLPLKDNFERNLMIIENLF